jgi:molybdopterin synthase sulfur carrier subunit
MSIAWESAMIKLLYFARLRESVGIHEETINLPDSITKVGQLRAWLGERGEPWDTIMTDSKINCAVNCETVPDSAHLTDGDELAFFPPVTGG